MIASRPLVLILAAASLLAACERKPDPAKAPAPAATPPATQAGPADRPQANAASGQTYSKAYEACMAGGDAAKGVTYAMQACIVDEMKIEDERLNATYQKVMKGLDEAGAENLRQAQRAWIVVRDSTCQANLTGGTIDRLNVPACRLDATIARTKELQAMLPMD